MTDGGLSPIDLIEDFDPHLPSVDGYALLTEEDEGKFPINECVEFTDHHSTPLYAWKMVGPFIVESLVCADCAGLASCTDEHVTEYAGTVVISIGQAHPVLDKAVAAANDPHLPMESRCETEYGRLVTFERRYPTIEDTRAAYEFTFDIEMLIEEEFFDLIERGTYVPLYSDTSGGEDPEDIEDAPPQGDPERRKRYNEMLESVQSDSDLDGFNEVT